MAQGNGYVKWWQLITAFLTLAGIFVTLFIWGANCVIANDRMRSSEDLRIVETWGPRLTKLEIKMERAITILEQTPWATEVKKEEN